MWTLLEIRPWPSPCIGVHCSRLLCSRPDVCSSAEIGKSRFYHPRTQFNWRHMRTIMFDFEYHKYFYFKQLIIGYLAWNWNKTMVLKCQIFEETFLQFASCLLSHRWVSALVTTKNVFKSRLFATNLPASPGDIRKQKYCNDQTEMSQFRVTCYCEMISICPRLAAQLASSSISIFTVSAFFRNPCHFASYVRSVMRNDLWSWCGDSAGSLSQAEIFPLGVNLWECDTSSATSQCFVVFPLHSTLRPTE